MSLFSKNDYWVICNKGLGGEMCKGPFSSVKSAKLWANENCANYAEPPDIAKTVSRMCVERVNTVSWEEVKDAEGL